MNEATVHYVEPDRLRMLVARLKSPRRTTRAAALHSLRLKLEHRLLTVADLVQERELISALLEWLASDLSPEEESAVSATTGAADSDSSDQPSGLPAVDEDHVDVLRLLGLFAEHPVSAAFLERAGAVPLLAIIKDHVQRLIDSDTVDDNVRETATTCVELIDNVLNPLRIEPSRRNPASSMTPQRRIQTPERMSWSATSSHVSPASEPWLAPQLREQLLPSPEAAVEDRGYAHDASRDMASSRHATVSRDIEQWHQQLPTVEQDDLQRPATFSQTGDSAILSETTSRIRRRQELPEMCRFISDVLFDDFPTFTFLLNPELTQALLDLVTGEAVHQQQAHSDSVADDRLLGLMCLRRLCQRLLADIRFNGQLDCSIPSSTFASFVDSTISAACQLGTRHTSQPDILRIVKLTVYDAMILLRTRSAAHGKDDGIESPIILQLSGPLDLLPMAKAELVINALESILQLLHPMLVDVVALRDARRRGKFEKLFLALGLVDLANWAAASLHTFVQADEKVGRLLMRKLDNALSAASRHALSKIINNPIFRRPSPAICWVVDSLESSSEMAPSLGAQANLEIVQTLSSLLSSRGDQSDSVVPDVQQFSDIVPALANMPPQLCVKVFQLLLNAHWPQFLQPDVVWQLGWSSQSACLGLTQAAQAHLSAHQGPTRDVDMPNSAQDGDTADETPLVILRSFLPLLNSIHAAAANDMKLAVVPALTELIEFAATAIEDSAFAVFSSTAHLLPQMLFSPSQSLRQRAISVASLINQRKQHTAFFLALLSLLHHDKSVRELGSSKLAELQGIHVPEDMFAVSDQSCRLWQAENTVDCAFFDLSVIKDICRALSQRGQSVELAVSALEQLATIASNRIYHSTLLSMGVPGAALDLLQAMGMAAVTSPHKRGPSSTASDTLRKRAAASYITMLSQLVRVDQSCDGVIEQYAKVFPRGEATIGQALLVARLLSENFVADEGDSTSEATRFHGCRTISIILLCCAREWGPVLSKHSELLSISSKCLLPAAGGVVPEAVRSCAQQAADNITKPSIGQSMCFLLDLSLELNKNDLGQAQQYLTRINDPRLHIAPGMGRPATVTSQVELAINLLSAMRMESQVEEPSLVLETAQSSAALLQAVSELSDKTACARNASVVVDTSSMVQRVQRILGDRRSSGFQAVPAPDLMVVASCFEWLCDGVTVGLYAGSAMTTPLLELALAFTASCLAYLSSAAAKDDDRPQLRLTLRQGLALVSTLTRRYPEALACANTGSLMKFLRAAVGVTADLDSPTMRCLATAAAIFRSIADVSAPAAGLQRLSESDHDVWVALAQLSATASIVFRPDVPGSFVQKAVVRSSLAVCRNVARLMSAGCRDHLWGEHWLVNSTTQYDENMESGIDGLSWLSSSAVDVDPCTRLNALHTLAIFVKGSDSSIAVQALAFYIDGNLLNVVESSLSITMDEARSTHERAAAAEILAGIARKRHVPCLQDDAGHKTTLVEELQRTGFLSALPLLCRQATASSAFTSATASLLCNLLRHTPEPSEQTQTLVDCASSLLQWLKTTIEPSLGGATTQDISCLARLVELLIVADRATIRRFPTERRDVSQPDQSESSEAIGEQSLSAAFGPQAVKFLARAVRQTTETAAFSLAHGSQHYEESALLLQCVEITCHALSLATIKANMDVCICLDALDVLDLMTFAARHLSSRGWLERTHLARSALRALQALAELAVCVPNNAFKSTPAAPTTLTTTVAELVSAAEQIRFVVMGQEQGAEAKDHAELPFAARHCDEVCCMLLGAAWSCLSRLASTTTQPLSQSFVRLLLEMLETASRALRRMAASSAGARPDRHAVISALRAQLGLLVQVTSDQPHNKRVLKSSGVLSELCKLLPRLRAALPSASSDQTMRLWMGVAGNLCSHGSLTNEDVAAMKEALYVLEADYRSLSRHGDLVRNSLIEFASCICVSADLRSLAYKHSLPERVVRDLQDRLGQATRASRVRSKEVLQCLPHLRMAACVASFFDGRRRLARQTGLVAAVGQLLHSEHVPDSVLVAAASLVHNLSKSRRLHHVAPHLLAAIKQRRTSDSPQADQLLKQADGFLRKNYPRLARDAAV